MGKDRVHGMPDPEIPTVHLKTCQNGSTLGIYYVFSFQNLSTIKVTGGRAITALSRLGPMEERHRFKGNSGENGHLEPVWHPLRMV